MSTRTTNTLSQISHAQRPVLSVDRFTSVQETDIVGQVDQQNRRQGLFFFYEDSKHLRLYKTVEYKDGIPHGFTCQYRNEYIGGGLSEGDPILRHLDSKFEYVNGKLAYTELYELGHLIEVSFENGFCKGFYACYYANGLVREQGFRNGGKLQGTQTLFDEHGRVLLRNRYENGLKQGREERYDEHGELMQRITWLADEKHGPETLHGICPLINAAIFSPGDKCRITRNYVHGVLSGLYFEYLNGAVVTKGQYADGKRVGLWECFNPARQLIRSETYLEDALNGPIRFQVSAYEVVHGAMLDGKRHGPFYHLARPQLHPIYCRVYEHGTEKYQIRYDVTGRPVMVAEVSQGKLHGMAIKESPDGYEMIGFFNQGVEDYSYRPQHKEIILSSHQNRTRERLIGLLKT